MNDLGAPWVWVTLGLVLAGLELLVPGTYLIWLAVAALGAGALTGLLGLTLPWQVVSFAVLAMITVYGARRFLINRPMPSADPLLNKRGTQLVGQSALVVQPITHGTGRVHIGDTEWIARGPDVAAGKRVRITGSEGAVLLVEKE